MGFLNGLTLVFILCKLLGVIDWPWFLIFLPSICSFLLRFIVAYAKISNERKSKR